MNAYQATSHKLHALGFNVTAIKTGTKRPGHPWETWETARQTLDDVNALPWRDAAGVGILSGIGGFRAFDFDKCPDFGPVATVLQNLELPDTYPWVWRSGSGNGWGILVRCFETFPAGALSANGKGPGVYQAPGVGFDHLELRYERCQTVLPPSRHPTGPGYAWQNGEPTEPPATVAASRILAAFRAVTVAPAPKSAPAPARSVTPTGNGYGAAALRAELDTLGRATVGNRNKTLNRAAFALGQLVAGGELDRGEVERALLDTALAIGLGEKEAAATLRSGLDDGATDPRKAPLPEPKAQPTPEPPGYLDVDGAELPPLPTAKAKPTAKTTLEPPALAVLSARQLLTTAWPEPVWAVPGLFPVGLTLLGGRPKLGKSWLALQLTQAVATGGVFLGRKVQRGPCLYLALEDPPRRLAERMRAQAWVDYDAQADFVTVGSLRAGGGDALAGIIRDRGYRLVVIDTLSRALAGDQNDGQAMTAALTPLQEVAHQAGVCVLLIDHHNKVGAATTGAGGAVLEPDPLINLSGHLAKSAMADCVMGLYRQAGKRGALLVATGRDIEEQRLCLLQDAVTCVWQVAQDDTPKITDARAALLAVIDELGEATLKEICETTGKDKGNLYKQLQDLVNLGLLVYRGKQYALPEANAYDD